MKDSDVNILEVLFFNEIQNIARQNGFRNFVVDTWVFNRNAKRFFENLGFDTYNIKMWRNDK
jgi:hypothetical protein